MWTEEQRARHAPRGRRYASDLTDAEWAVIAPDCSLSVTICFGRTPRFFSNLRMILSAARLSRCL